MKFIYYQNNILYSFNSIIMSESLISSVDISVPVHYNEQYLIEDFACLLQKQLPGKIVYCVDGGELYIIDPCNFPPANTITVEEIFDTRFCMSFKSRDCAWYGRNYVNNIWACGVDTMNIIMDPNRISNYSNNQNTI